MVNINCVCVLLDIGYKTNFRGTTWLRRGVAIPEVHVELFGNSLNC
jgi:hypothetical protein